MPSPAFTPAPTKTAPNGRDLRLVEETTGHGSLEHAGEIVAPVDYTIARYLGLMEGSGLPIPGLHSIDGRVVPPLETDLRAHVGARLTLHLADGRAFGVTLLDADGRIGTEARHAIGCLCC